MIPKKYAYLLDNPYKYGAGSNNYVNADGCAELWQPHSFDGDLLNADALDDLSNVTGLLAPTFTPTSDANIPRTAVNAPTTTTSATTTSTPTPKKVFTATPISSSTLSHLQDVIKPAISSTTTPVHTVAVPAIITPISTVAPMGYIPTNMPLGGGGGGAGGGGAAPSDDKQDGSNSRVAANSAPTAEEAKILGMKPLVAFGIFALVIGGGIYAYKKGYLKKFVG